MQILEHGNQAPIITCATCNCKYMYNARDIKTKETTGEDGAVITTTKTVVCPECGKETTIE